MSDKRVPRVLRIDPGLRPRSLRQDGDELAARTYRAPRSVEDVTLSSEHTPKGERRREGVGGGASGGGRKGAAGGAAPAKRAKPAKRPSSGKKATPSGRAAPTPRSGKASSGPKTPGSGTPPKPRRATPAGAGSSGPKRKRGGKRFAFEDAAERVLEAEQKELVAAARELLAEADVGDEDELTVRLVEHFGTDPSIVAKLRLAKVAEEVLRGSPSSPPRRPRAPAGSPRSAPRPRPTRTAAVREVLDLPFDRLVRVAGLVAAQSGATGLSELTSLLVGKYGTGADPQARRRLAQAAQSVLGQGPPAGHRGRYGPGGSSGASSTRRPEPQRQESGCASAAVVIGGVLMALSVLLF